MDSSTVIANSSARLLIIFLTFFHLRVYGSDDLLQFLLGYIAANETFYAICDPATNILAGISEEIVINACRVREKPSGIQVGTTLASQPCIEISV